MTTQDTKKQKHLVLFNAEYPEPLQSRLTEKVKDYGMKILPVAIGTYKSGERYSNLYPNQAELFEENKAEIAGAHVQLVMQMDNDDPTAFFFDTINTVESIKEYNPASIHVIMPFAPFARQDHDHDHAGNFMSRMAKTFPKHLKFAGADTVTTFDVHSLEARNYFKEIFGPYPNFNEDTAIDSLSYFIESQHGRGSYVRYSIGAPDGGNKPDDLAQERAHRMAGLMAYGHEDPRDMMFKISKTHTGVDTVENTDFEGGVYGCDALEVDDMIDRGGTMLKGATTLKKNGARKVIGIATHGIFSDNTLEKLTSDKIPDDHGALIDNPIDCLIVTDSVLSVYKKAKELTEDQQKRLHIVSVLPLVVEALRDNQTNYLHPQKNLDLRVIPA